MIFPRGLRAIRESGKAFVRAPALSLALLFTIALGVGSNASVYGFVQGLIHPDSPLGGAAAIVSILGQDRVGEPGPLSRREYRLLTNEPGPFDWIEAVRIAPRDITIGGVTRIAVIAEVPPDLARALNLPMRDGVIVGRHMAQTDLGSSADTPGQQIRVDNRDLAIAGVAPPKLDGLYSGQSVDLWLPSPVDSRDGADSGPRDLWVLARLRQGVSIAQAQAAVGLALRNSGLFTVVPYTGAPPRTVLGLLRIGILLDLAAGAVFFVASINVASLLFARALKRSRETSLRIALGATRSQLIGELFSDSLVISVAGGALGALLAIGTAHVLPALLFQEDAASLVFSPHVLPIIAASLACVCLTVLCGMMPVFATVTDRPWIVLGRESGLPSKRTARIRTGLVLGQITFCYVLVIGAVFLFEGLHSALQANAGRHLGHPILAGVEEALVQSAVEIGYFNRVERAAKSVAGFTPRAWASQLPGDRPIWGSFKVQPSSAPLRDLTMDITWLANDSLQALNSRLLAGRTFGFIDQGRSAAVIDEDAAAKLFGQDSIGMTIQDSSGIPVEIIGVVKSNPTAQNQRPGTVYYINAENPAVSHALRNAHFRVPVISTLTPAELNVNVVSPPYFSAFDFSLIAGRQFPLQQMPDRSRVGIVNQEAADLYFGGKPLGAAIVDEEGNRTEIIGVVGARALGNFQHPAEPTIYFPMQQDCAQRMTLILDGPGATKPALAVLLGKIESVPGHDSAPVRIETIDAHLARTAFAPLRIATLLSSALALMALLLSVLGLMSAQGDAERQRRRELALRIALGSQRCRVFLKVIGNAIKIALAGTALGALVSLAIFRVLGSANSIFSAPSIRVWLLVASLPTATVFLASLLPALRASRVEPLTIMRDDH